MKKSGSRKMAEVAETLVKNVRFILPECNAVVACMALEADLFEQMRK